MNAYEQYISISTATTNSREDVDMTTYFYPNGKAKSVVFPSTDLNNFAKAVTTHLSRNKMNVWRFKRHLSEHNQPNRGHYYGFVSFTHNYWELYRISPAGTLVESTHCLMFFKGRNIDKFLAIFTSPNIEDHLKEIHEILTL